MYLNKLKIASTKVICNIFITIGAFFWFFAAMFVIFMITHVAEDRMVALAGGGFMTVMAGGLASVFTFPAVLLKGRIYRAEKYNRIFEEDYDGLVPYSAFPAKNSWIFAKITISGWTGPPWLIPCRMGR